jgi:anti-sigma B factor antagonist
VNGRPFNVTLTEQAEGVVVRVFGEVDIVTAPVLQRHLESAIGSGRPTVVIDLAETTFLDARGVGALVNARKRVTAAGGRMVIRRPPALVRRVLELADQVRRTDIAIED